MLKKTMLLIDLFCKYASSFRDDNLQIRDPNQLTMKFIKPEDIKIKKYTSETIPPNLLNLLQEEYNNGGGIMEMYYNIERKAKGYRIYCAYVGTDLAGVIVVNERKSANIFVANKYRQQYVGTKLYNAALKENKKLSVHNSPLADPFYSKVKSDYPKYDYNKDQSSYYFNNDKQEEQQQYDPDQLVLFKNFEGLLDRIKNYNVKDGVQYDQNERGMIIKIIKSVGGYNNLPTEIYDYIIKQLVLDNTNIRSIIESDLLNYPATSGIEELVEKVLSNNKQSELKYYYTNYKHNHNK